MQTQVPETLDLSREPEHIHRMYGLGQEATDAFGRKCLLARKLIEKGVRFVQLYNGTWDSHDFIERAHGNLVVFDSGGGSSQFTFGRDANVSEQFSVNVGAARFTERFGLDGPVGADVVGDALAAIAGDLSELNNRTAPDAVVAMGGTVTNLAARLCGEAQPGQVLISKRVLASVEELVDAEPVGALTLKGFVKSVPAFNVTGLKSSQEASAARK